MNAITQTETTALTRANRVTTQDVCNTLRYWDTPSHDDLVMVIEGLAAKVQAANALSAAGTAIVVDGLDEVVGQIENDKVEQQEEQTPKWDSLPCFGNVRAELDALTVMQVGV